MTALVSHDPDLELWPMTRAQYELLVDAGELAGKPVELLEGMVVWVPPQGEPHARTIEDLTADLVVRLREAFGRRFGVRVQLPLAATDTSVPEPDIAVVDADRPRGGRPTTAHLVVEVAASSHRADLQHKARIYAAGGVPAYWVVDLTRDVVVVHTGPRSSGDGPAGYASVVDVPFEGELDLLGLTVRMTDLLR